jgi:hypothetical protein
MKLKRAIAFGALLWVLIFFEVCALMFGLKLDTGLLYYAIHYSMLLVLTAICALSYFKKDKQATLKEGFRVGLVFLVTGLILDCAITIPLFVKTFRFFIDPFLIIAYIEGLAVCTMVGKYAHI